MADELLRREFLLAMGAVPAVAGSTAAEPSPGPAVVPAPGTGRFWERVAAATPLFIRDRARKEMVFPFTPAAAASRRLDELKDAGIDLVEVYAPAHGGRRFLGLDTIDRYKVEPRAGTMDDFKRLVDLAHAKGMWIISIDNFGYASVDAVDFLKACDDVRAGRDSREARFFAWSDSAEAPPPGARGDRYFMTRPTHLPGYESSKHELWQWSERARRFYWTKWEGVDLAGKKARLPQFNWGSAELVDEMEKVMRFWMDTGIDGIMIDAVNWYVGCDWEKNRRAMTDAIASYGDKYCQPEGAGAFRDDPVSWITEGRWTCIQDYGLGIYWEKGSNVVTNAIEAGDPRPIERALRDYHDRVVDVGGTLYYNPPWFSDPRKTHLSTALVTALGDLIVMAAVIDDLWSPVFPDEEQARLLEQRTRHAAFHALGRRQALPVAAPDRHYAFLKVAAGGGERVLVVLNFRPEEGTVEVDLSGVDFGEVKDLATGAPIPRAVPWRFTLPPYGYRFFSLTDRKGRVA
jgi:hypothetical protein